MIQETKLRVEHRQAALAETMTAALNGSFRLLEQLTEVESMVRVLQLVSVLVEVSVWGGKCGRAGKSVEQAG